MECRSEFVPKNRLHRFCCDSCRTMATARGRQPAKKRSIVCTVCGREVISVRPTHCNTCWLRRYEVERTCPTCGETKRMGPKRSECQSCYGRRRRTEAPPKPKWRPPEQFTCPFCKASFWPNSPQRRFCSRKCRDRARYPEQNRRAALAARRSALGLMRLDGARAVGAVDGLGRVFCCCGELIGSSLQQLPWSCTDSVYLDQGRRQIDPGCGLVVPIAVVPS